MFSSNCEVCGKRIVTRDKRGQKFCSRKCFAVSMSIAQKGKPTPAGKYWLGKKRSPETIEKMRSKATGRHINYPKNRKSPSPRSAESRLQASLKTRGNKNHFWKGGVTPLNLRLRMTAEYRLWREAVFKRDNYICVWCGQHGGRLNADHIKAFSLYPELRFAIDNGRTLCERCHRTTDNFGFKARCNHVQ